MPSMGGSQAGDDVSGSQGSGTSDPSGGGLGGIDFGGNIGRAPGPAPTDIGVGAGPGSTPTESLAESSGLSPSDFADMVNAGMNPNNPVDLALARIGVSIGLPPNPAKASHMSVMGPFLSMVPGAMTLAKASRAKQKGQTYETMGHLASGALGVPGLGELASYFDEEEAPEEEAGPFSYEPSSFSENDFAGDYQPRKTRQRPQYTSYLASALAPTQSSSGKLYDFYNKETGEQAEGGFTPWWREGYLYRG